MTISSVSSSDLYSQQISSLNKSSRSNPLQKALSSIESDLESGDTSSASSVLADLFSHAPKSASSSSATSSTDGTSSNPGDKITSYLKTIQSSLSSGDTAGAETALSSLQDYVTANQPPMPPAGADGISGISGNGNPLQKALASLSSDLESGDTTSASSVVSDIISHTERKGNDTSSSSTISTSSTDEFSKYLNSLKSALSSGDTTSAKSLVSSMEDYLTNNQPQPPSYLYSADGSFSSGTSTSGGISLLA